MIKKITILALVPMTLMLQGAFVMKKGQTLKKIDAEHIESEKPTPIIEVPSTQMPTPTNTKPTVQEPTTVNTKPTVQEPTPTIQETTPTNTQTSTKVDTGSLGTKIYEIDFGKHRPGVYTEEMMQRDFYAYKGENLYYKNHDGSWMYGADGVGNHTSIVKDGEENVLRVKYLKGKVSPHNGGVQILSALPKKTRQKEDIYNPQEVTLVYSIKFERGFSWTLGGKLPGLGGGLAIGGGLRIGEHKMMNGFNARFMFHRLKEKDGTEVKSGLIGYIYHPGREGKKGQKAYGAGPYMSTKEPANSFWDRDTSKLFAFSEDRWYEIRQTIKANTPNKADGTMRVYIDGKLAASFGGMKWIADGNHGKTSVDRLVFSTFYGGEGEEYEPTHDSYTRFKGISVWVK